ncbi:MAG: fibronectin type III domain-containing protein [Verrucomicrobia bacterium]|nr:fibronectin type III domain-containing protein [Verrucomicrobiota bacterium]
MRRGIHLLIGICIGLAMMAGGAATGAGTGWTAGTDRPADNSPAAAEGVSAGAPVAHPGTAKSAGGGAEEELIAAEDYIIADFEPTEICVDHYLTRADGWSPIEVRVAELDFTLWMDARGWVHEYRQTAAPYNRLFRLDLEREVLERDGRAMKLAVREDSDVRLRLRLAGAEAGARIHVNWSAQSGRVTLFEGALTLGYFYPRPVMDKSTSAVTEFDVLGRPAALGQRYIADRARGELRVTPNRRCPDRTERLLAWRPDRRKAPPRPEERFRRAGRQADAPNAADCGVSAEERAALIALYLATGGDNWTDHSGWRKESDPTEFSVPGTECYWAGVWAVGGHVGMLLLFSNNLTGSLPPEIGYFPQLEVLELDGNPGLTGPLPSTLGNLGSLEHLSVSWNDGLTGSLPSSLGQLGNLIRLYASSTSLSGPIPPELGDLPQLDQLSLGYSQFSGAIPPEIGNIPTLRDLSLSGNHLTGEIPGEIGQSIFLETVGLNSNQLDGALDRLVETMSRIDRELPRVDIAAVRNLLEGSLPDSTAEVQKLSGLYLDHNQLSGELPANLGEAVSMRVFTIGNNLLEGRIPGSIGGMAGLEVLSLESNHGLFGGLPQSFFDLPLQDLSLAFNPELCNSNSCCEVVDGHRFIPACFYETQTFHACCPDPAFETAADFFLTTRLSKLDEELTRLNMAETGVGDGIGQWLGNLNGTADEAPPQAMERWQKMQELIVNLNRIKCEMDMEIIRNMRTKKSAGLRRLDLDSNAFWGEMPPEIVQHAGLEQLGVYYNGIYTDRPDVAAFLSTLSPYWEWFQNPPPTGVQAHPHGPESVIVSWEPVLVGGGMANGGYNVYFGELGAGALELYGSTADKTVTSHVVYGLDPARTYCFAVQTWTAPHDHNANLLESPLSAVVTAMPGLDDVLVTGQVTAAAGYGVPDVLVEFAGTPADFYTLTDWHGVFHQSLPLGWQGVVTPVAANWTFAPEALALAATGPDLPDQDFQATARLDAPPVGDIDGDYFLTAKDLVIFRHVPSGNTVYASAAAADLDGDGVVSRQDIPLLGQKIAGNR